MAAQFPCDPQGVCMVCKVVPPDEENLTCNTCATPWHAPCLSSSLPATVAATNDWQCPDCTNLFSAPVKSCRDGPDGELVSAILSVKADESLTASQKARKCQQLLAGKSAAVEDEDEDEDDEEEDKKDDNNNNNNNKMSVSDILTRTLNCSICIQLPERPVTTPCGHSFCLKCFEKWIRQGKRTCAKCRQNIPASMASQPRINSALVFAIRMARASKANGGAGAGPSGVRHFLHNQDRPDQAYTTDRAQRSGRANACSGKIFVTVPTDHFGPILPQNDPLRNQGLLVGESWLDRLECRQWGAHFVHVGGIAGQSDRGAQSVVLSGGYVDDQDHGEWFLYTGSGGKDLTGNKRTNKNHSFDQKFEKYNRALQLSCLKGYPVRVVRSHKEKRSSYAPEKGVRYDGIYRIEKCWQIAGVQGFKVCRFLFVRCDNEPAPWTSDDHGDRPRPLPAVRELNKATGIHERTEAPAWDFDEANSCWKWMKPPPPSRKKIQTEEPTPTQIAISAKEAKRFQYMSIKEQLRKGFSCLICSEVMVSPVTTPCAHNFCKPCLEGVFAGKSSVKERSRGGRTLRAQKVVMKCPGCTVDISDYLQNLQVDIDLKGAIESLKAKAEENGESLESSEDADACMDEDTGSVKENSGEELSGSTGTNKATENGEPLVSSEDADACKDEDTGSVKENSVEELNGSTESKKVPDQAVKRNAKRKKNDSGEQLADKGDGQKAKRGRKSRKVEKAVNEANDSPSSPLDHQ
ncbi:E3 ubiquitin-protein ligase ORTHRUS 2-like [Lotus japonicus]|uniref:E3 ubiquitin-protein ligase ORTHRUS 2-like n=1 Tax=Lotus japonicus TaxID=34305 RepID=UPI00258C57AE|nr:E3 ubiquitin-protein ligase ORTHRUS 2-like [Lotus japonicus]